MQNYYQTLETEPDAAFAEIKAAYRKKALLFHPDRGGSHAQMVRINEAWEVLSNPELRSQYDESLKNGDINGDQFAGARSRSQNYARDWKSFDSWLSSIERDFASAKFGSRKVFGMEMPTASGSISAWVFLITGGLIGLLFWTAIFVLVFVPPKKEAKPQTGRFRFPPSVSRTESSFNPLYTRIVMLTCVASVAGGAWCGRWTHQKFGSSISNWLPKSSPFPFFRSATATIEDRQMNPTGHQRDQDDSSKTCHCPNCQQKIRVPDLNKRLQLQCPKCQKQFDFPNTTKNPNKKELMKFPPTKTSLASLLRGLLIFEITFGVIAIGLGLFETYLESQFFAEMGLVQEMGSFDMFSFAMFAVAFVILLPMMIASWFGLFQQRNWGRWLYLGSHLFASLLMVFMGCFQWNYRWGLVLALETISSNVSGIILAICFLSPLGTEFMTGEKDNENADA